MAATGSNPAPKSISILPYSGSTPAISPSQPLSAVSPTSQTLTTKQWEVPPRPKPGRKPATDTPPTKRKAQNRAAQRAFRERRAAKVGELEVDMKAMKDYYESELAAAKHEASCWQSRYQELERKLQHGAAENGGSEAAALARGDAVPLGQRPKTTRKSSRYTQAPTNTGEQPYGSIQEVPMGCGRCTMNSRCECLESALNEAIAAESAPYAPNMTPNLRRPLGDGEAPGGTGAKRQRKAAGHESNQQSQDASHQTSVSLPDETASTPSAAPNDPCGFCEGSSACPCAELASQTTKSAADTSMPPSPMSEVPIAALAPLDPTTATSFNPQRSSKPPVSRCGNDPGSCAQCQKDPTSTLFCKSLAAARNQVFSISANPFAHHAAANPAANPSPCSLGAGCCRLEPPPNTNKPPATPPSDPPPTSAGGGGASAAPRSGSTLSCAEAFHALSQHPAFPRAAQRLSEWLPRLATTPNLAPPTAAPSPLSADAVGSRPHTAPTDCSDSAGSVEVRADDPARPPPELAEALLGGAELTAFEIEAASVMGVMKYFDRRFLSKE